MTLSVIADVLKAAIAKKIMAKVTDDFSSVAGYVKINESGIEVDPAFWVGRFCKVQKQGGAE